MFLEVNDTRLYFDVQSEGLVTDGAGLRERPTLIVLQGGPGFDHGFFGPDHGPVADVAQVICLDHRGNGRSRAADPATLSLNQWADDLAAFIGALGLHKPVVLGMSFGGFVAMTFASRYPSLLSGLILCSTCARAQPDRSIGIFERLGGAPARDAAKAMFEDYNEATAARFFQHCIPCYSLTPMDKERFARVQSPPELFHQLVTRILPAMDLLDELNRIECPTLVMCGEDDPITPLEDARDIAGALGPRLDRFVQIPGARHFLRYDAPETYFGAIREFMLDNTKE